MVINSLVKISKMNYSRGMGCMYRILKGVLNFRCIKHCIYTSDSILRKGNASEID